MARTVRVVRPKTDILDESERTGGTLAFRYHDAPRLAVVRAHTVGKLGNSQVLVWQTGGATNAGDLPGRRRMSTSSIRRVRPVDSE